MGFSVRDYIKQKDKEQTAIERETAPVTSKGGFSVRDYVKQKQGIAEVPSYENMQNILQNKKTEPATFEGPDYNQTDIAEIPSGSKSTVADYEKQLADLKRQNAELSMQISGLSRGLPYDGSGTSAARLSEYESQLAENEERIKQLQANLEKQKRSEWEAGRDTLIAGHEGVMSNPDFQSTVSQFDPSSIKLPFFMVGKEAKTKEKVLRILDERGKALEFAGDSGIGAHWQEMTDDEKAVLSYYAAKGEWDKAGEYLDRLETVLTARERSDIGERITEFSKEHPVAGTALSVASSFTEPLSYIPAATAAIKEAVTGEYQYVDINAPTFQSSHIAEDTTEGIHQAISEKLGDGTAAKVATFLADTGLSILNFASKIPMGPTGALAMMASGAAGQKSYDVLKRGGTAKQAALIGAASGIIEALTEKIPLDNLFAVAAAKPQGLANIIKAVVKQASIEATEEIVSEVANNILDIVGMGGLSEFEQYIENLKATKGYTQQQAESEAFMQFFVLNTLTAAAGGALSGGVMGGGAAIIGNIYSSAQQKQLSQEAKAVYRNAATAQNELNSLLSDIAGELGIKYEDGTQKTVESMVDKVLRKRNAGMEYDLFSMKDHARGKLELNSFDQIPDVLQILGEKISRIQSKQFRMNGDIRDFI